MSRVLLAVVLGLSVGVVSGALAGISVVGSMSSGATERRFAPNVLVDLADGQVTTVPALNRPTQQQAVCRSPDGRVLVSGGLAALSDNASDRLEATGRTEWFDPRSRTWSSGPPLKVPRCRHRCVTLTDGDFLIVGGLGADPAAEDDLPAERLTPGAHDWQVIAGPGLDRFSADAVPLRGGGALIASGRYFLLPRGAPGLVALPGPVDDLERTTGRKLEGQASSLLESASGEVQVLAALAPGRFAFHRFDEANHRWERESALSLPWSDLNFASMVPLSDGTVLGSVETGLLRFDPRRGAMKHVDTSDGLGRDLLPLPSGKVLLFGGPALDGRLVVFDPGSGARHAIARLTRREGGSAAVVDGGHVLLLGGVEEGLTPSRRRWVLGLSASAALLFVAGGLFCWRKFPLTPYVISAVLVAAGVAFALLALYGSALSGLTM